MSKARNLARMVVDSSAGGTGAVNLPNGTTAQRPSSTGTGQIRYNTELGQLEWYGASEWQTVTKFDYVSSSYPSSTVNPLVPYATWYNSTTKVILVCVNNTTNANVWREIITTGNASRFDLFGDGSAVALYTLDGGSGSDMGGLYPMNINGFSSGGAGKINTCAYGNPAYMACGSVAGGTAPNNSSVVTVSLWIKSACSGDNYIWSSGKYSNGTNKRGLLLTGTTINSDYTVEYGALPSLTITPNTWTHICVSGNKVYKNGALIGTMASYSGPSSDTYGFYIGANGAYDYGYVGNETYGKPMNGYLDHVRIFNRVLTDAEVNTLYLESL